MLSLKKKRMGVQGGKRKKNPSLPKSHCQIQSKSECSVSTFLTQIQELEVREIPELRGSFFLVSSLGGDSGHPVRVPSEQCVCVLQNRVPIIREPMAP